LGHERADFGLAHCFPEGEAIMNVRIESAKYGASFGSALAIAVSYNNNHSVLWAIIDGVLSWLYVIYFVIVNS
jgi:hypothetical protein